MKLGALASVLLFAGFLAGCRFGVPPDPNERSAGANPDPEVLRNELDGVWLMLQNRIGSGEITRPEAEARFREFAVERLENWDPRLIPPDRVWLAGQVFRSARRWDSAQTLLRRALQQPMSDEQRVSTLVSLAAVEAELGNVEETIRLLGEAGTVEDPYARRIVLPETLNFIVPALLNRTAPDVIFRMVENAITIHLTTSHPARQSPAGRQFERERNELAAAAYEVLADIRRKQGRLAESEELKSQAERLRS
jgi:tetratricopeptide (TPR) repeat protein